MEESIVLIQDTHSMVCMSDFGAYNAIELGWEPGQEQVGVDSSEMRA